MITPADASLHTPTSDDPTWAETNFFGFYVPQLKLNIGVYALLRPNLGTALSSVCMNSRRASAPWEADYCNVQAHLPMGRDFDLLDYSFPNGLAVRCSDPNQLWTIDYDPGDGAELHVEYRALMPPFDIQDPEMDPMVRADNWSWGTAYKAHFDQTGVFSGEVVLDGTRTNFECVSTMDHSWGPRTEAHSGVMSWLHAHFSENFAIHGIFSFDPASGGSDLSLAHGYVLEDGEVYGLKAGAGKTSRRGWFPDETVVEVTDRRDRTFSLRGAAHTSYPFQAWPSVVGFTALMSWDDADGRTGLGETQDYIGVETLCKLSDV